MRALLLAVALAAAPAPVQKGRDLAAKGSWIDLYLAYSAGDVGQWKAKERRELSGLLLDGARALAKDDEVMAFSLAERAVDFHASAEALKVLAAAAKAADQRGSAEKALRKGMKRYPRDGAFPLALGKLLLEERDPQGAAKALARVPRRAKEYDEARALLAQARAAAAEEAEAERTARAVEKRIYGGGAETKTAGSGGDPGETRVSGLSYESSIGPGGMRTRGNSRFVFRYFNNQRDFGERAEYEGQVSGALEDAYRFTRKVLGRAREAPVDVVLYTREEFMTHHGAGMARAVAGFYSDNAIRMNDAAEMTRETRATLVHEYVHAAVDEFAGGNARHVPMWVNEGIATWVEWRYLGSDGPPLLVRRMLQAGALKGGLPSLAQMNDKALIAQANPTLAYATSGMAVKLLLKRGGVRNLLKLIEEVGAGQPLEEVLEARYGRGLARLNEEVADELKSR